MNFKEVCKFTESVYDLFVLQHLSFPEVLEILKGSSNGKLKALAEYLSLELEKGNLLSEALLSCEIMSFDVVFVMFIKFAEKTGDLAGVFTFLKERCDRKKQNVQKIVEASAYPLFVVVLALTFCVCFLVFGRSLFSGVLSQDSKVVVRFCRDLFFLILSGCFVFYLVWKNMRENKLYEAFLGMGFLIKAGVNVSLAVGYGMLMVGPDSRYGKVFAEAQKKLEYGMDLKASFGLSNDGGRVFAFGMDRKISDAFYFAQQSGEKSDVFEKIAGNIKVVDEKRRKLCMCLVEPMLIAFTGAFLLILVVNVLLPLFTNITFV